MRLSIRPIRYRDACEYIEQYHRHHKPPQGWKFGMGLYGDDELCGVITVGNPVARKLDDGLTLEVTRCCVREGVPNGCSFLYGKARRAAQALGYERLITYTLESETGATLQGAGWRDAGAAGGGSWSRPSRERTDKAPLESKRRWEAPCNLK
jgi:hypothetical protein